MEHSKKEANSLINESSPYLLQHAYNPVKWLPWSKEAFKKANEENKLVLISVGYSACHWCHVMEKESFEDVEVAQLMNENFICIKVDREERPDVDNLYMTAVQIMTGQGGWPLNCFALPDGRPIYGGTYFPKKQWMNLLVNLSELLKKDKEKVEEYAKSLTEGIKQTELINIAGAEAKLDFNSALHKCIDNWKPRFDNTNGGANKVPK
ncbi:MAG: thioredoxin domain-containing protein, partial [Bacteroidia bacterium]|nr:thioredoxin domain-containing protein [Bacteroidia bacterium]